MCHHEKLFISPQQLLPFNNLLISFTAFRCFYTLYCNISFCTGLMENQDKILVKPINMSWFSSIFGLGLSFL